MPQAFNLVHEFSYLIIDHICKLSQNNQNCCLKCKISAEEGEWRHQNFFLETKSLQKVKTEVEGNLSRRRWKTELARTRFAIIAAEEGEDQGWQSLQRKVKTGKWRQSLHGNQRPYNPRMFQLLQQQWQQWIVQPSFCSCNIPCSLLKPTMIGMCRREQGYIKRCLIDCNNYPYKQMEEEGVESSNPLNSIWYLLNGCVWNKRTRRQAIFVTGTRRQGMTAGTTWLNAVAVKTNKVIFGR